MCCAAQAFVVNPASLQFDIQIAIASSNASITQTLHLNPSSPMVVNNAGTVTAQLLGDLASYASYPDFSSYYLMIPSPAGMHGPHPGHSSLSGLTEEQQPLFMSLLGTPACRGLT